MKIGYAAPLATLETMHQLCDAAARAGFDYFEVPLAPLGLLEGREKAALDVLSALSLPCLAAQSFLPRGLVPTGPEIDENRVKTYLGKAAEPCQALGIPVAVFGAAWSRNVPDGARTTIPSSPATSRRSATTRPSRSRSCTT